MANNDSNNGNLLEELFTSIKDYLNMKIEDVKFSLTENLALLCSKIIFFFLAAIVLGIAVAFLASAFSAWMGDLLGSRALGALITAGIFVLIFAVMYLFRRKFFTDSMVRMFLDMFFDNKKDE